ncbi:alcohol dehydrogenase catalytic domain-containing protein [Actinoplanes sp. GCM10030250]|uniref:alcohol dehydrogenase catalytic domain-containing protein n=1 Tax=Actinoplanes sp. GCM10030250 TaxID=3273376 RepID=UPI00361476F5
MKAWQLTSFGTAPQNVELPEPVPGPGQVLLDIKAAGLCHTDISFIDGEVPGMPNHLPIVLGHEVAGVIRAVGEGVDGFAVGDAVGVAAVDLNGPGVGRDGGYAEQTVARVDELVRIPEGVSFAQAAAGTDAGATSYHAVAVTAGVHKGTRVGVIGLGGLGQTGARIAVLLGAEAYGVDVREERRATAEEIGAAGFFTSVADLAPLELDVIIDFAGFDTTGPAIEAVKPGGRVVQIGAGKPDASIPVVLLVTKNVTLVGSLGAGKEDVIAVYGYLGRGELAPEITTLSFDQIGEGLGAVRRGMVSGRNVAVRD